jgi:hypothetical protein
MSAKKRKAYPAGQISLDLGDLRPRVEKLAKKHDLSVTKTVKLAIKPKGKKKV